MKQTNPYQQRGQSQVEYALLIALIALVTIITLVLLGPQIGDVFSRVLNWSSSEESVEEPPEHIVVRVVAADGTGIEGVRVYAFNAAGRYQGKYGNTNSEGELIFEDMADGGYKFRANYQDKHFWSEVIQWPGSWLAVVETGQRPFTVRVVDAAHNGVEGVRVYAFTDEERYIGVHAQSDANGEVIFDLTNGSYKFRANYRRQEFWSAVTTVPSAGSATIETGERPFTVRVVDAQNNGIENVRVYAFTSDESYTSVYGNTDSSGVVVFDLPNGSYKFRANYRRSEYWSDVVQTPGQDSASIQTQQAGIDVVVTSSQSGGLADVRVFAFNADDRYVGVSGNTDAQGRVTLDLPDGSYKFRANYRSAEYWSAVIDSLNTQTVTIDVAEGALNVYTVDGSGQPRNGVHIYVFTDSGRYTGVRGQTDANGLAIVTVPPGPHTIRANYRGNAYWSAVFDVSTQTAVTITTE